MAFFTFLRKQFRLGLASKLSGERRCKLAADVTTVSLIIGIDRRRWNDRFVLVVWLCGQVLDGYVITPKVQGDKTGLGFAGVIFSFIFWPTVLGPLLGLLLAIPLSAFCVVLWRTVKSTYIRPVV